MYTIQCINMRSLYESILDDEDVLMNDVKKSINDPFEIIYNLFINNADVKDIQEIIDGGILNKFIEKKLFLNLNDLEIRVVKRQLSSKIKITVKDQYDPVCCILYFPDYPDELTIHIFTKEYMEFEKAYWLKTKFFNQLSKVRHNIRKEGFTKTYKRIDKQYSAFIRKMR